MSVPFSPCASGHVLGDLSPSSSSASLFPSLSQGRLEEVNVEKAVSYVLRCMNFDGGFGRVPGSESHAGQVRCCYGEETSVLSVCLSSSTLSSVPLPCRCTAVLGLWRLLVLCIMSTQTSLAGGCARGSCHPEDSMVEKEGGIVRFSAGVRVGCSPPAGRPEKLPDVCYSWWVLSSLAMIGRLHWIDKVRRCSWPAVSTPHLPSSAHDCLQPMLTAALL